MLCDVCTPVQSWDTDSKPKWRPSVLDEMPYKGSLCETNSGTLTLYKKTVSGQDRTETDTSPKVWSCVKDAYIYLCPKQLMTCRPSDRRKATGDTTLTEIGEQPQLMGRTYRYTSGSHFLWCWHWCCHQDEYYTSACGASPFLQPKRKSIKDAEKCTRIIYFDGNSHFKIGQKHYAVVTSSARTYGA